MFTGAIVLVLAYALGRSRRYVVGAYLAVFGLTVPSYWLAYRTIAVGDQTGTWMALIWLAPAIVYSGFVLPFRQSILANVMLVSVAALLPLFHPVDVEFSMMRPLSVLIVLVAYSSLASAIINRSRKSVMKQIRERERAEAALKRANEQLEARVQERTRELVSTNETLEALVASSPAAVVMLDLKGRVVVWNRAAQRIFGWKSAEILGKNNPIVPLGQTAQADLPFGQKLDQKTVAKEIEVLSKEGQRLEISLSCAPIRDSNGEPIGILGLALDITEHRQLEAQLRQSQKMEAIGRLAGGIAHDFNNLLTVIRGNTDILKWDLDPDSPLMPMATEVYEACQRASDLTKQLTAFSRSQVIEIQELNLNAIANGLSKMLRRLLDPNIILEINLQRGLYPLAADRVQIEQIILNLVVNANDAMPQGGKLVIETSNRDFEPGQTIADGLQLDKAVVLRISDTGCGISQEVQNRMFEPFYTTKEPGKGTGLGLATVFGIIKQAGGGIEVESQINQGTIVLHLFPAFDSCTPSSAGVVGTTSCGGQRNHSVGGRYGQCQAADRQPFVPLGIHGASGHQRL